LAPGKAKGLIQDGKSLFTWHGVPKEEDGEEWEEAGEYIMGSLNISLCTGQIHRFLLVLF